MGVNSRRQVIDRPWVAHVVETVVAELACGCPGPDEVDLRAVVNQSAAELGGVAPADLPVRLLLRVRGRVNAALGRPLVVLASATR